MELALVTRIFGGISEAGVFGLGWALFIWAMWLLRIERRRYQDLVVHIIQYFTKINMIQGTEDDTNAIRAFFRNKVAGRHDDGTRPNPGAANDERAGTK